MVKIDAGSQPGDTIEIRGRGLPLQGSKKKRLSNDCSETRYAKKTLQRMKKREFPHCQIFLVQIMTA